MVGLLNSDNVIQQNPAAIIGRFCFLQRVSIAGYVSAVIAVIGMFVCLSVCHALVFCQDDAS